MTFLILIMIYVCYASMDNVFYNISYIEDTVYIANGTIDSSLHGDYMYAIFNSPE